MWIKARRIVWPTAIAASISALLVVLGLHIPTSQLTGFAETRFVAISPKKPFVLSDLSARNFGLSFFGSLRLPDGAILSNQDITVKIEDLVDPETNFTSIPGFEVPSNVLIVAETTARDERLALRFADADLQFDLLPSVGSRLFVDAKDCDVLTSCVATIDTVTELKVMATAYSPVLMQFDAPLDDAPIATRVAVSSLDFAQTEIENGRVVKNSGIIAGRVRFIETPESARDFDHGEIFTVLPSDVSLRGIILQRDRLSTQFSGSVTDASVEIGDTKHSLMPTWFDALANNQYVKFLFAVCSMLVGVEITWRKMRSEKEE